ncbi:MAG: hypothetical protein U0168_22675 [Nannocystaceae bacterium]
MRQPLYLRLRPFLRRELRAKLVSAVVTLLVLCGLTWLGVSALTGIDSREAHNLRVSLGIESPWSVCGAPGAAACSYEDREQGRVDAKFEHERKLRLAVLDELSRRIAQANARLDDATALVLEAKLNPRTGALQGDTVALRQALAQAAVDLRPAPVTAVEGRRERLLWALDVSMPELPGDCRAIDFDGIGWVGGCDLTRNGVAQPRNDQRRMVLDQIAVERATLAETQRRVDGLRQRDAAAIDGERPSSSRLELVADLLPQRDVPEDYSERLAIATWLAVGAAEDEWADETTSSLMGLVRRSGIEQVGDDLGEMARHHVEELAAAVTDAGAGIWYGGWLLDGSEHIAISKISERYRSPVTDATRVRLFGSLLMILGALLLVVVGPTVTATTTAREREAGTLPVLRMTGLSAGDLAMAMTIGPNVYALVTGLGLVLVAGAMLAATAGVVTTAGIVGTVLAFAAATYLTAIGLGDALGQRVNALVVGGLLGFGVLVPGIIGATMLVGDMAATGLLLGPLPATIATTVAASGLPYARMMQTPGELVMPMLGYALAIQFMLGVLCLTSWRRRVEQPWAPLFRPVEGAALGLASVGCSALALLDLCEQIHVQTYDQVNLVTFVATGFLMPVLGCSCWSRAWCARHEPPRSQATSRCVARSVASSCSWCSPPRRWRPPTPWCSSAAVSRTKSGIMWATIAQGLLVAETAVATLLLASRRRDGRHRVLILGAAVVLLQLAFTAGVYNLEVEYVAFTQSSAHPLLVGMGIAVLDRIHGRAVGGGPGPGARGAAAGRDRTAAAAEASAESDSGEGEGEGEEPERWLH